MKIKDGFILRTVADTHIVVAVGKESKNFNKMIKLNDSAAFLWKQLSAERTVAELANELSNEYGISPAQAEADAQAFADTLREAGLLV